MKYDIRLGFGTNLCQKARNEIPFLFPGIPVDSLTFLHQENEEFLEITSNNEEFLEISRNSSGSLTLVLI